VSAQPNFDPVARPYRGLEYLTLGRALERCRFHYLPDLVRQRHALVLGDGDGRFLARLLRQNLQLHADAVDTSAAMLRLLRRHCAATASNTDARLKTCQTDALNFSAALPEGERYDLVVTHFFLDCLTQADLEALIARVTPVLVPEALWLVSDFRIPTGAMRLPARALVRSLYLAFRILTGLRTTQLPDHATPLTEAGFRRISFRHSLGGILTTELWRYR
jgi:ubiquinone/menaquinone biosynthesis C-methylase UbiE